MCPAVVVMYYRICVRTSTSEEVGKMDIIRNENVLPIPIHINVPGSWYWAQVRIYWVVNILLGPTFGTSCEHWHINSQSVFVWIATRRTWYILYVSVRCVYVSGFIS